MKKVTAIVTALALTTMLSACGESKTDRALSGGAIGAGAGALVGGTNGALIGGALGAGAGAVTDKDDVNLGKPIWR